MTRTEKFVSELCTKAFLPLWSHPNPIGKKGKELCDILIVCNNVIVIISVKEIVINEIKSKVDYDRWAKRAIDDSVKQIYGAERFILDKESVILFDKKTKTQLPHVDSRKIYRIAVAFGRGEVFPLKYGNFGKGFVHVLDETSIQTILNEFDTIADFVNYLDSKEEFIKAGGFPLNESENDLIGYYIFNSNSFSTQDHDLLILDNDIWTILQTNQDYIDMKKAEKVSYIWDKLINTLCHDYLTNNLINQISREDIETSIQLMAKETRSSRKILSELFLEFIGVYEEPKSAARIVRSMENKDVVYVFMLNNDSHKERNDRAKDLQMRCFVARSKHQDIKTVIGLATERYNPKGYSLDVCYLHIPEWTDELNSDAMQISETLNLFNNPIEQHRKMK